MRFAPQSTRSLDLVKVDLHSPNTRFIEPAIIDWTAIPFAHRAVEIVARAASRMMGGTELSRNKLWLHTMAASAMDGTIGAQKIKQFPRVLRPLVARFIPELRRIPQYFRNTQQIIVPILEEREKQEKLRSDFLQWMSDEAQGKEKEKTFMATILLKLSFVALFTTATAIIQALYDLCARPEYMGPLRDECEAVLKTTSIPNRAMLAKMQKLDSFMKESQRFNPIVLSKYSPIQAFPLKDSTEHKTVTFARLVVHDYHLSDGFVIPAGTNIGVPAQAITMDPDIYADPTRFDGMRFHKMRQDQALNGDAGGRLQWAASNLENMAFGYGRCACPGRHFASYVIKLVMVDLLMRYDMRFPPGVGRPANVEREANVMPDAEARILMRKRT